MLFNKNQNLVIVMDEKSNKIVGQHIIMANSFFTRFKGLMMKKELAAGEGLLLSKTKQIHTFWMRIPIDVVYLKRLDVEKVGFSFDEASKTTKYEIVGLVEHMEPWKIGKYYSHADSVLELKAGQIKQQSLHLNTKLVLKNVLNSQYC